MLSADPSKVSRRAKKRGLPQLGTLGADPESGDAARRRRRIAPRHRRDAFPSRAGAGNHYCEIQIVDEVHDEWAARRMGIGEVGQVVVMIHSGSRGLGHQVATDALLGMERAAE